jgi:hypothetical protein
MENFGVCPKSSKEVEKDDITYIISPFTLLNIHPSNPSCLFKSYLKHNTFFKKIELDFKNHAPLSLIILSHFYFKNHGRLPLIIFLSHFGIMGEFNYLAIDFDGM